MKKLLLVLMSIFLALPACATNVSRKMEDSTVLLKVKVRRIKDNKTGWGTCSGVYIKNNIILSAAHCVEVPEELELKEIWIRKGDESEKAVVVKLDANMDLLMLYTPLAGTPVKLAKRAVRGEDCWVIGNPLGIVNVITRGIVSGVNLREGASIATFIIVDAIVLPGNSGGAVVDKHGRLLGILTQSTSFFGSFGASGLGFAVDLRTIREFLK